MDSPNSMPVVLGACPWLVEHSSVKDWPALPDGEVTGVASTIHVHCCSWAKGLVPTHAVQHEATCGLLSRPCCLSGAVLMPLPLLHTGLPGIYIGRLVVWLLSWTRAGSTGGRVIITYESYLLAVGCPPTCAKRVQEQEAPVAG
jgi:hypothetical protein